MLTNNDILKKLKIALSLKGEDVARLMGLGGAKISETEIEALFRKPDDRRYREAGDQILRQFLDGLIVERRGPRDS